MAEELTLEFLEGVKKADYIKAFKNKAAWKKASAVIFMVDYKIEGKKSVVAIPFKKEADMKVKMKEIKKDKKHLMKKTCGGLISLINDGPEGMKAKVEIKLGGMKPELLQEKGGVLFGKIKVTLEVAIAKDAEMETEEEENENVGTTTDNEENNNNNNNNNTTPSSNEKPTTDVKLILAKIAKLNKTINLKDGLQESDLKVAAALQAAIREFAAALKTADAAVRAEYGETFLKTKKIYAKLEEEIKRLKAAQNTASELDAELNETLGEEAETEDEENVNEEEEEEEEEDGEEAPQTAEEAKSRNEDLMSEITELMKAVNFNAMA